MKKIKKNEICSIIKIKEFIKKNKEKGQNNQKIIQKLMQNGCSLYTIFNAMNEISTGVKNESI